MCNNHPHAVMTLIRDICDSGERYKKPIGRYREDLAIAVMTHMIPWAPHSRSRSDCGRRSRSRSRSPIPVSLTDEVQTAQDSEGEAPQAHHTADDAAQPCRGPAQPLRP
jgi:hypothetical protein